MAEEHFDAVVDINADTSAARAQVLSLQQQIRELERRKLNIRADTSSARAEVNALRRQVEIGASFGLNDTRAKAQLRALRGQVQDLATVKLQVDADTLRARAQLAGLKDVRVRADVDSNLSGLQQAVAHAGNLSRTLSRLPPSILATAATVGVLTAAFSATTLAAGGVVAVTATLGAVALRENETVRDAFSGTAGFITQRFTSMSEKLIPAFVRMSDEARKSFSRVEPDIDRIVAATVPAISGLSEAAGSFGERVTPGFRALAEASGPVIEGLKDFASNVGGAVNDLLQRMAASSEGAGQGMRLLGDGVSLSLRALGDLIFLANSATEAIGKLSQVGGEDKAGNIAKGIASQTGIGKFLVDADAFITKYQEIDQKRQQIEAKNAQGFKLPAGLRAEIEARNKALANEAASRQRLLDLQKESAPLASLDATKFQQRVDASLSGYESLQNAAKSLTQAEAAEASTRTQNARAEASARRSVAAAAQGVRDAQVAGARQIEAAEKAVAAAQARTREAQERLTQARRDATQALEDMRRTVRDLPDTEESARLRLERARLGAAEAGVLDLSDSERERVEQDVKRREALLELKNAQEELDDALVSGARTREEAADLERRGIENAIGVLDAKAALRDALINEREAEKSLAQTRVDAARAVQAANESLAVANENLNQTIADNAIRSAEAAARTQEMRDKAAKAKVEADLLAASMGMTSEQLRIYSENVDKVPTLALKLAGQSEVIDALDAVTIKARAIQLLALHPDWTAEKATETAATEITGKKTIQSAVKKLQESTRAMFQFRAQGGPIYGPGTSTSDSVPVMASRGEFMQPTSAVEYYGRDFMEAVRTKRLPKFASGGLIDFPLADLRGLPKLMEDNGLFQRVRENAKKALSATAPPRGSGQPFSTGPTPPGQLNDWISAAIAHTGVGESWRGPLYTLIMRESGGNPNAINLWDSNAKAGYPSQGLVQTIPQTFAAYRDKSLPNNIVDPVANIVAGINYMNARYGGIFNVQQANPNAAPKGYAAGGLIFDEGGVLPTGKSVVDNRTGKPEPLLRTDKAIDLSSETILALVRTLAQVLASRPARLMMPDGRVLADAVAESLVGDITISGVTR